MSSSLNPPFNDRPIGPDDAFSQAWAKTLTNLTANSFSSVNIPLAGGPPLADEVPADIATISLGPGEWDVRATIGLAATGGAVVQRFRAWIGTEAATPPVSPEDAGRGGLIRMDVPLTANAIQVLPAGTLRVSLGKAGVVRLGVSAHFTSGFVAGFGYLSVRKFA